MCDNPDEVIRLVYLVEAVSFITGVLLTVAARRLL